MRFFLVFFLFPMWVNAVTLALLPTTKQAQGVGEIFQVTVQVSGASSSQQVAGAQLSLRFDPSALQVTDVNGNPIASLTPDPNFNLGAGGFSFLENRVDNTAGTIRYDNVTAVPKLSPVTFVTFFAKTLKLGKSKITFDAANSRVLLFSPESNNFVEVSPALSNMEVAVGDVSPPEVINLAVSSISNTSATVTFATIDSRSTQPELTQAFVEYGVVGKSEFLFRTAKTSFAAEHTIDITSLSPSTNYIFRVVSVDQSGNTGSSLSATFQTTNRDTLPPTIAHQPIAAAPANQTLLLQATVKDNVSVAQVLLFFRSGTSPFQSKVMRLSSLQSDLYSVDVLLPASGLDYYFEATDSSGNVARLPSPSGSFHISAVTEQAFLSGTVTEQSSGLPLDGVFVAVSSGGQGVFTDSQGKYALTVVPGNVTVSFQKSGFVTENQSVSLSKDQNVVLDAALLRSASVVGKLLNQAGNLPLDSVSVVLATGGVPGATGTTDSTGSFQLANVPPGDYTFTTDAPAFEDVSAPVTLLSGETKTLEFFLKPLPVQKLVIFPSLQSVASGETFQFVARGITDDGAVLTGFPVDWRVSPAFLGTVDSNGLFTAGNESVNGFLFATLAAGTLLSNGAVQGEALRAFGQVAVQRDFTFVSVSSNRAPFSPRLRQLGRITYQLSQAPDRVEVWIFGLDGTLLRKLDGAPQAQGNVFWDGRDALGRIVKNGVYPYQIISERGGAVVRSAVKLIAVFQ